MELQTAFAAASERFEGRIIGSLVRVDGAVLEKELNWRGFRMFEGRWSCRLSLEREAPHFLAASRADPQDPIDVDSIRRTNRPAFGRLPRPCPSGAYCNEGTCPATRTKAA